MSICSLCLILICLSWVQLGSVRLKGTKMRILFDHVPLQLSVRQAFLHPNFITSFPMRVSSLVAIVLAIAPISALPSVPTTENPTGVFAVAEFPHSGPNAETKGYVIMTSTNGVSANVHVDLVDLPQEGGPFTYHIHEFAVGSDNTCDTTGPVFNPYSSLDECPEEDQNECAVGNLAGKHGALEGTCFETDFVDPFLSLNPTSRNYVVGRALVIHYADGLPLACATILVAGEDQLARIRKYTIEKINREDEEEARSSDLTGEKNLEPEPSKTNIEKFQSVKKTNEPKTTELTKAKLEIKTETTTQTTTETTTETTIESAKTETITETNTETATETTTEVQVSETKMVVTEKVTKTEKVTETETASIIESKTNSASTMTIHTTSSTKEVVESTTEKQTEIVTKPTEKASFQEPKTWPQSSEVEQFPETGAESTSTLVYPTKWEEQKQKPTPDITSHFKAAPTSEKIASSVLETVSKPRKEENNPALAEPTPEKVTSTEISTVASPKSKTTEPKSKEALETAHSKNSHFHNVLENVNSTWSQTWGNGSYNSPHQAPGSGGNALGASIAVAVGAMFGYFV